ncbi:MAG: UDP-glucose 4-epimerase GalE [Desulfovibrio sp.]|nr:MAG: UDP-glucose 4-epimerase GalE [Desulfovibrio sp.]
MREAKQILVCGGAGYIGSHMAKMLAEAGYGVTVLDNLSTGNREALKWGEFVRADLRDPEALDNLFSHKSFYAVMHFAALIQVGESVAKPAEYYDNNVIGAYRLLEAMRAHDVDRFVFSSTAAVYGEPQQEQITEDHPLQPLNPYGRTKLHMERMLEDYATAYQMRSVRFRYFNAAGADPSGEIGESHDPESHLIPNVLMAVLGEAPQLSIFGHDYPTRDGTAVRDYIHVHDLAAAHLAAIDYMDANTGSTAFNLGNGTGFTVKEIIEAAEKVTGRQVPHTLGERRAGDAAILVADSAKAQEALKWTPEYIEVGGIIETAWQWHRDRKY